MHLRALTSIKRDNGQLYIAGYKALMCEANVGVFVVKGNAFTDWTSVKVTPRSTLRSGWFSIIFLKAQFDILGKNSIRIFTES